MALAEGKRAAELDPLSPQISIDNSMAYIFQGNYEGAKEQAKRASELDPTFFFAPMVYGWADLEAGRFTDAIPWLKKAAALDSPPFVTAWLAYAHGASGDRVRALAEFEHLKQMSPVGEVLPFNEAMVHLGLGDRTRAIDFLERAYAADSQMMPWIGKDRIFDALRSEPRFVALMRKLQFAH